MTTTLENRLRRKARKHGLRVTKSRDRSIHLNNLGGYMLVDSYRNAVIAGDRFDVPLEELEAVIDELS